MIRPRSWLVLGILQICFGAWGIVGGGLEMLSYLFVDLMAGFMAKMPGAQNSKEMADSLEIMRESLVFNVVHGCVYLAAGIWQIVAGIGLLRFRRGARLLNLAYAWFDIVCIVTFAILTSMLQLRLHAKFPDQPGAEFSRNIGVIGVIVTALITLAYPLVLIVLLRRDPFATSANHDDAAYGADDPANPYRSPGHAGGG